MSRSTVYSWCPLTLLSPLPVGNMRVWCWSATETPSYLCLSVGMARVPRVLLHLQQRSVHYITISAATYTKTASLFHSHALPLPCPDPSLLQFCQLCPSCQTPELSLVLKEAFLEHVESRNFHRLIPALSLQTPPTATPTDRLMHAWFAGKCKNNARWCN